VSCDDRVPPIMSAVSNTMNSVPSPTTPQSNARKNGSERTLPPGTISPLTLDDPGMGIGPVVVKGAPPGTGTGENGGIDVAGIVIGEEPGMGVTRGRAVTPRRSVNLNRSERRITSLPGLTLTTRRVPKGVALGTHEPGSVSGRSVTG